MRHPPAGLSESARLDGERTREAQNVQRAAGLVVRAREARAAERLLADHGAGALLVQVHVPARLSQHPARPIHRTRVLAVYRSFTAHNT